MDPLDSGMRYSPRAPDPEWDTSIQFLPASNSKKLEKKRVGKVGIAIIVVIVAAVIALIIGLVVWHFQYRRAQKVQKIYSGSMRITNQMFQEDYENPNSTAFRNLAFQVEKQLKSIYSKTAPLSKYYKGSTVQALSEGGDANEHSVTAYYLSEFNVPNEQAEAVDKAMTSRFQVSESRGGRMGRRPVNTLQFEDIVSGAVDARMVRTTLKNRQRYSYHTHKDRTDILESPGFPDNPYPPNLYVEWELRADVGNRIKLEFVNFNLENDCGKDFMKVYDSLVAIEQRVMAEKCGYYAPNEPLTFISSGNVMLVTLVTNEEKNFPGFRAQFSQVPRENIVCGGKLTGLKGTFTSPNYPSYYPPLMKCSWDIKVPEGKYVKVQFNKFLMTEPGQGNKQCLKDSLEINKTKLCGSKLQNTVIPSTSNTMILMFISDQSYVDRGFSATYEAFDPSDPCPAKFKCANNICINLSLKCDGWNDCGDNSDEKNCQCEDSQITCKNSLCKPKFWQCDGVNDCGDNTDEDNCGGCKSDEFTCRNERCISAKKACDGTDDCGDGTDELGCTRNSVLPCTEYTYKCKDNKCISKQNPMCDGAKDCEDGSDEANCECGTLEFVPRKSRIVGGDAALEGEWPWQVSLHVKGMGHVCGASVINNRWLVTAAHCVQDNDKVKYSQPQTWEAYLGLHVQQKPSQNTLQRNLKQIIPHPYYNTYTFDNDIALMELDTPVPLSQYIWPICLPPSTYDFPAGESVWITGWGATREGGSGATVLQKAEVRIINSTVCNQLMGGQITSRMLCAGVLKGGVDACQGDSGGPLSYKDSNNRQYLAGVVSWGDGCARRNKPGIYTRVTEFRAWIKEKTGV
ncbi:ST14 transmembrane serine protease matriptase b [Megalops cyprinoides]|uniref:ST14 transmembrane serine protease matriptase b n=1 Tax=Megalops cyprinoides TaxID=118141 RepID=UPI001864BC6B|nr:ST14 transmembrane serine protease matriptase b [Megalops cyprinoides]